MEATLIDGRAIADQVLIGLAEQVRALGVPLQLAAVCAGDDEGLKTFVRLKQKAAHSIGLQFSSYFFDADQESQAREAISYLASDDEVQGIFVELPLPSSWDASALTKLIPSEKDVDVLARGDLLPPSVRALQYIIDAHAIPVLGVRCAVVGAGALVGQPIGQWLSNQGAQVEVMDISTTDPALKSYQADIVIAATGVPGLITDAWIKGGATVIDFGYGKKGDAYVGDVDFDSVSKKAGLLTPVPGGMGPLVVAAVLENLLLLATR